MQTGDAAIPFLSAFISKYDGQFHPYPSSPLLRLCIFTPNFSKPSLHGGYLRLSLQRSLPSSVVPLPVKRPIYSQLNWAILLCDVKHDGKTEKTAQF
jgi:hypothetical protein